MQPFHFWSRDVHPVQNLLLYTKFHENWMIFCWDMAINDFQNGGRPPSWNCVTPIRDHPRSLCCWLQLPIKFHVYLNFMSIWYTDLKIIAIWIFCMRLLLLPIRAPKMGFGGLWTPECDYSSSRPPKGTSLCKSASFKLSTVKIRWGVRPVASWQKVWRTHAHTDTQVNLYSAHA